MVSKQLLYLPVIALILLFSSASFVFEQVLTTSFTRFVESELETQLDSVLVNIKNTSPVPEVESIQKYLKSIPFKKRKQRFTLIDSEGTVIGDSSLNASTIHLMPNHKNRPEIKQALDKGIGSQVRFSNTKGIDMLYIAKPVQYSGFSGVARMAVPLDYINNVIGDFFKFFLGLMFITILLVVVISVLTNHFIQQSLNQKQAIYEANAAKRKNEIELLHRLANFLAACSSFDEAQKVVKDLVPKILGDVTGSLSLMRSSRNQLEIKLAWGGEWPGHKTYSPEDCWALRKGKYHLAHDEFVNMPCAHMEGFEENQTLCIPLIAHGNTIGMMHLYLGEGSFDKEQLNLSLAVAEHLGLAMANLELQNELRQQALRDPLTGLYNRRYMEETVEQEVNRAERREQKFSVLMLDMDHFKRFNDNFGHDAGDYVLKTLATVLTKNLRGEDSVCRIGGEEIAILLPEVDHDLSVVVAEKLCAAVRDMHLDFNGQSLGKLSISIGIATYPDSAVDINDLIKQADNALYRAKQAGRDQYVHINEFQIAEPIKPKQPDSVS